MTRYYTLLFFLILFSQPTASQNKVLSFKNLGNNDGLSQNGVTSIFQDNKGYMWFGTHYGLNKYNGLEIKTFYSENNRNSLCSNTIEDILQDDAGNLWISSYKGLTVFNPISEKFYNLSQYDTKKSIFSQNIKSMKLIDKKIMITSSHNLYIIDPGKEVFTDEIATTISKNIESYKIKTNTNQRGINICTKDKNDSYIFTTDREVIFSKIINNQLIFIDRIKLNLKNGSIINSFYLDHNSNIWVGTSNSGLYLLRKKKGNFIAHNIYTHNKKNELFSRITDIDQDFKKNIIVTSRSNGAIIIHNSELTKNISDIKIESFGLPSQKIKSIYLSSDNTLWLGTLGNGVYFQNNSGLKFENHQIIDPFNLSITNNTRSIYKDSYERLWFGTLFEGLYIFDRTKVNKVHLLLKNKSIFSICKIDKSNILIGASDGIFLIKYNQTNFNTVKLTPSDKIKGAIFSITSSGTKYWIGTNTGLYSFNLSTQYKVSDIVHYNNQIPSDPNKINTFRIVEYDKRNNALWLGTQTEGLIKAELNKDLTIKEFHFINSSDNNSENTEYICDIFIDKKNHIWTGTRNGLLHLKTHKKGGITKMQRFTTKEGLPSNLVQSIECDTIGNLWLGTNRGLVKFNKERYDIVNYDINDGLQGYEFSEHSSYSSHDGILYFGGINGVSEFSPNNINYDNYIEPVDIKNIIINGINFNDKRTKDKTDNLELTYTENNLIFDFASPNYINPNKRKYLYKLDGFDKNWISSKSNKHLASYNNLKKGNYTFKVKASNNDGSWPSNYTSINIQIAPSFWTTITALTSYLILLFIFIFITVTITRKRLEKKNKKLLDNQYQVQMEKATQSKLEFFINISHEIRTPLTLILCSIEKLISNFTLNKKQEKEAFIIDKNVNRILQLTNELLSIRKMETGNYNLKVQKSDIIRFLRNSKRDFKTLAKQKNIKISIETELEKLDIWFDINAFEKIINNLISNAIKYNKEEGTIKIVISHLKNKKLLKIDVIDNGIGIDKKHHSKIFNRFYNQGGNIDRYVNGYGIGLSLTKSLIELHKGEISVQSEPNKGATFTIFLPTGTDIYIKEEKADRIIWQNELPSVRNNTPIIGTLEAKENNLTEVANDRKINKYSILYVDDNIELLDNISNYFQEFFTVFTAENGVIGFQMANEIQPDVIISDIVMPKMNGIELCKALKNDIKTSHIPLILLTAKGDVDSQIEGAESGADYFIPKPFSIKLLNLTIKNLLTNREKTKKQFKSNDYDDSSEITTNNKDKEFLDKLLKYVNDNISEENLNINHIADDFSMSRSTFYRKIKVISGTTGKQFIDTIRLKKATQLLRESDLNISEIAYYIGHTNPQYFSKWFKSHYKTSPTEYKENYKKK